MASRAKDSGQYHEAFPRGMAVMIAIRPEDGTWEKERGGLSWEGGK
jgi:hypothetical protein